MKFHDYLGSLLKSKVLIVSALTSLLQVSQNDIAGPSQSAPPFSGLVRISKRKRKIKRSLANAFESYFCECFPVAIGTRSFRWKIK